MVTVIAHIGEGESELLTDDIGKARDHVNPLVLSSIGGPQSGAWYAS